MKAMVNPKNPMSLGIVNINGKVSPLAEGLVSVLDRSFLYGDSLYEVARTYNGKLFALQEHLDRLSVSAQMTYMTLTWSPEKIAQEMEKTLNAFYAQREFKGRRKNVEAYCRLIVSRGSGKIGFSLSNLTTEPLYVILVLPIKSKSEEKIKKGMSLQIATRLRNDRRALDPAMKTGNYLNCLLAVLEANHLGFDDAIFCNTEGFICEGTTFNVFYVRRGIVATPPLASGVLVGITRKKILEICHSLRIPVREAWFQPAHILNADEVFVSGSVREVFPVTRLDSKWIGKKMEGPITSRIRKEFTRTVGR